MKKTDFIKDSIKKFYGFYLAIFILLIFFSFATLMQRYRAITLLVNDSESNAEILAGDILNEVFFESKYTSLSSPQFLKTLELKASQIIETFKVRKFKVFDHDGKVLFSTAAEEIGTYNKSEQWTNQVAKGKKYSALVKKDKTSTEGVITKVDVIESYIPVISKGTFIGSFEIYLDKTAQIQEIKKMQTESIIVIVISFIFVLFTIGFLQLRILQKEERIDAIQKHLAHTSQQAAIGTLAAGIAHEVNNPLAVISGNIDFLRESCAKLNLNEKDLNRFDKVLAMVDRIGKIISRLGALTTGKRIYFENINLHDSINNVLNSIKAKNTGSNEINFNLNLSAKNPIIHAEPNAVEQILLHLITNAEESFDKRQEQKNIQIETFENENRITLKISDTGKGIKEEHLNQIFNPFFTTKEPGKSIGLGLSITEALVSSIGANISADSKLGKGSSFIIEFDADQNQ